MAGPLQGVRVFDLTHAGVGPWATMIMAAMGANVVKIESPQGDTIRNMKPRYQDLSTVYMHCNLGKKGVTLDLKTSEGRDTAKQLLAGADVFAENMKWGTVARLGMGFEDAIRVNPRLVYGNFPGWGSVGPYRDRGSADLTSQAFSGAVSITGARGGDGEFIRWYALYDFNASSYALATMLLGLLYRERTGSGLRMESAQLSASVAIQASRLAEFVASGEEIPRLGSGCTSVVPHRAFRCHDKRWLAVAALHDRQWRALCRAIGAGDLLADSRFATNPDRVRNRADLEEQLAAIFATKAARWWISVLRRHHVPASLFYDYEAIPLLPQVRANDLIVQLQYPRVGKLPFGNLPFQYSRTPVQVRPGPWPGQDTEKVMEEGWGSDQDGRSAGYFGPSGSFETGVLNGVTVVDLTQGLSGPYASLLLADAGARVIKVEPVEGDYARHFGGPSIAGSSAIFDQLNRNKEGIRLDFRKPADREQLRRIVAEADIVLDEDGDGRLERFGVKARDLRPSQIHCRLTPFGTRGPLRGQPGAELVYQAMSDFLNTLGSPGEEPVRMGPDIASLGAGTMAACAVLGALYHRWRTGEGQQVTVNLFGVLLHQRGVTWSSVIAPDEWSGFYAEGYDKPPDTGYSTADGKIVMGAIRDPAQFRTFLAALGIEDRLTDPRFQHPPNDLMGYAGAGDAPVLAKPLWEEALASWRTDDLVNLLNENGSYSCAVNSYRDLFAHPQFEALDLVADVDDADLGRLRFLRPPWKLDGAPRVTPSKYVEKSAASELSIDVPAVAAR